jgi:ribosomal protein L11 methyltransferase
VPASWLQVSLNAPPSALDVISNFLIERGSPGVVIKRNEVQAFFARPIKASALERDIQRFFRKIEEIYPGITERSLRWRILKERNWNTSWRKFFSPQKVGKSFWIGPPWIAPPPKPDRKVIIIEPGMAFGTGTHATTRGCLEFLERTVSLLGPENCTALDAGTGSGILAIALAKLGVGRVWAVDNDPVARKVAKLNMRRNHVQKVVKVVGSDVGKVKGKFNIVVANLTAESLIALSGTLQRKVSSKGYLILSGILGTKAREVVAYFASTGLTLVAEKRKRNWITLLLKREIGRKRRLVCSKVNTRRD